MAGSSKIKQKREVPPEMLDTVETIARLAKMGVRTNEQVKKLDLGRFVAEHIDELSKEELKQIVHIHQSVRQGHLWELLTESVPLPASAEPEPGTLPKPNESERGAQEPVDDGFQF